MFYLYNINSQGSCTGRKYIGEDDWVFMLESTTYHTYTPTHTPNMHHNIILHLKNLERSYFYLWEKYVSLWWVCKCTGIWWIWYTEHSWTKWKCTVINSLAYTLTIPVFACLFEIQDTNISRVMNIYHNLTENITHIFFITYQRKESCRDSTHNEYKIILQTTFSHKFCNNSDLE